MMHTIAFLLAALAATSTLAAPVDNKVDAVPAAFTTSPAPASPSPSVSEEIPIIPRKTSESAPPPTQPRFEAVETYFRDGSSTTSVVVPSADLHGSFWFDDLVCHAGRDERLSVSPGHAPAAPCVHVGISNK
ncbi:hypothetical protein BD413DRAFT_613840 [Trametes elegans]|nr:hypothetical protein BD413DRAFT_613840 [Trametes elegans]